jgi:ABC-type Fe3+/spermidine/putrescine transport system ATPase subunit
MNRGRIEQVDQPEIIFERPATPFVAEFLGVANLLSGHMVSKREVEIAHGIRCATMADHAIGAAVRVGLRPENAEVFRSAEAPPDAIACAIIEAVYQGGQLMLELAPLAMPDLHLHAQLHTGAQVNWKISFSDGERVAVRWPAQSLLIYDEG